MIRFIFLLLGIAIQLIPVTGKADNYPVGANSSGMANSSVSLSSIWSVFHNQAGLAYLKKFAAGFHFENKYFTKELGLKAFALAIPTKTGTFALTYSYFGYSLFNETKAGLAFAKSFGNMFSVGIQLDYFQTHIAENYGSSGVPVAEIGIRSEPVKNFFIGAHVFNIWQSKADDYLQEPIPSIFRIGLGYKFSEKVIFTIETEKNINDKAFFKAGIEYEIITNFYMRTGISTNPVLNTFGLGYNFSGIQLDISASKHEILGYSTQISMHYSF